MKTVRRWCFAGILFLIAVLVSPLRPHLIRFIPFIEAAIAKPKTHPPAQLEKLNLTRLNIGETAVVKHPGTAAAIGARMKFAVPGGAEIESQDADAVILLDAKSTETYVDSGSGTSVIKSGTGSGPDSRKNSEKIDPEIRKVLGKSASASVIIRFSLPYENYYEPGAGKDRITDKKTKFNTAKAGVKAKIGTQGKVKQDLPIIAGISADIGPAALARLEQDPTVAGIEMDREVKAVIDTSVPDIAAPDVWTLFDRNNVQMTGAGTTIAIIDTGVDYRHADLGGCIGPTCKVVGGYDCFNNDTDPMDDHGHGTHVAATAAGKGMTATGQKMYGVAPDARIMAFKVLSSGGSGSASQIICGIDRATDPNRDGDPADHVQVASMSLGGSGNPDDAMSLAVDKSSAAGVVHTIAAGNSGPTASTINSPGTARTAITVAAACEPSLIGSNSNCPQAISSFSSRGPLIWNGVNFGKPDLAAPGVNICAAEWGSAWSASRCYDDKHVAISGTSMATPHAAGAAALVRQAFPDYSPAQIKQVLVSSATNLGLSPDIQGAGKINLKKAIPFSPKLNISPAYWTFTSDPALPSGTYQQAFSVSSLDSTLGSLTLSPQLAGTGISISVSKTAIDVSGGATDTFSATVTVDNAVAKSGSVTGTILFSSGSTTVGIIPVTLTVPPNIKAGATSFDYGLDDPGLTTWTSVTQGFDITNVRTDIPLTVTAALAGFPSGVTLKAQSPVSVPAGGTVRIDTSLAVNNASVANNIFTGSLVLTTPQATVSIPVTFTKFYVIEFSDTDGSFLASRPYLTIYDRSQYTQLKVVSSNPFTMYVNAPGLYDAILQYFSYYDRTSYTYKDLLIMKEGISVTSGLTRVTVSASEATNSISYAAVDAKGTPISSSLYRSLYIKYGTGSTFSMLTTSGSRLSPMIYTSTISPSYTIETVLNYPQLQPAKEFYAYYWKTTGVSGNLQYANTAADFKTMNIAHDTGEQSGTILPLINGCLNLHNWCSIYYNTYQVLSLPVTQRIYSLLPDTATFYAKDRDTTANQTPFFSISSPPESSRRWLQFDASPLLPSITNQTIYNGLGPSFWYARFNNTSSAIQAQAPYSLMWNSGFYRQDYAARQYGPVPVEIFQNGVKIADTTLPPFSYGAWYGTPILFNVPAAQGIYEVRIAFPYKNKGIDLTGKVKAVFNTKLTDKNPPMLTRLYYYSNNARSEVYDPMTENRLEFSVDPVGSTLGQVAVSYSTDNTVFTPLAGSLTADGYSVSVPGGLGAAKLTLNIHAVDSSGNSLEYTFELPNGTAPPAPSVIPTPLPTVSATPTGPAVSPTPVPPSPTPSVTPSPTRTPTPTRAPTPTRMPTPTATPSPTPKPIDLTPPEVVIIFPQNGQTISRNTFLTITAAAQDETGGSGMSHVDFYVNNVQRCVSSAVPYTCKWKPTGKAGTTYTITVHAMDKANNQGLATATVRSQ